MSGGEPVAIHVLDREFLVACTPEEREGLLAAARHLDGKMREMRNNARTVPFDRIAVLAALNLSHELLSARRRESAESTQVAEKLQALNAKLERVLPGSLQ